MSSPESQEIIDAQYHTRELQVDAILRQTDERFRKDFASRRQDYQAIEFLLTPPPVFAQMMFDARPEFEEEIHQKAAGATKTIAEHMQALGILKRLARATKEQERRINEVAIENQNVSVPKEYTTAFLRHPELLTKAASEGREEGSSWKYL